MYKSIKSKARNLTGILTALTTAYAATPSKSAEFTTGPSLSWRALSDHTVTLNFGTILNKQVMIDAGAGFEGGRYDERIESVRIINGPTVKAGLFRPFHKNEHYGVKDSLPEGEVGTEYFGMGIDIEHDITQPGISIPIYFRYMQTAKKKKGYGYSDIGIRIKQESPEDKRRGIQLFIRVGKGGFQSK